MYENIRGITVQGKCFISKSEFNFFPNDNDRISIVYGKNGSGKSTLSECFSRLAVGNTESELKVSLVKRDGSELYERPFELNNLYIFNEEYIDENIKIDSNGLNTIILFGEQVDVDTEIAKTEMQKKSITPVLIKIQDEQKQYNNSENLISPQYYYERVRKTLKEDSGWADVDAQIKNLKQKSAVSDKVINEICSLNVIETEGVLEKKFRETKELLSKITDNTISFPNKIEKFNLLFSSEEHLSTLLGQTIEKPILSEREQLIIEAVQQGMQNQVENAKEFFSKDDTELCPFCYQPLSNDYKKVLVDSIDKVLNKDVDKHKKELLDITIQELEFDGEKYIELNSELTKQIFSQVNKCNEKIKRYKEYIEMKFSNLYTPVTIESLNVTIDIGELNNLIEKLENQRLVFNDASKKSKSTKEQLLLVNKMIANKKVIADYSLYKKQLQKQESVTNELTKLEAMLKGLDEKIKQLNEKKENVVIAIENINKALEYVFFSKKRLEIELKNKMYLLKSNDRYVKPKDVSCGERNIIALCYFFTQIMNNTELKNMYKKEQLIVIDDPVSSFDFENKIGILSYIKAQIKDIICGNINSKVIILSHDLATIFDLQKASQEVCAITKGKANQKETTFSWLEIDEDNFKQFKKSRSEYTELLKLIYVYAKNKTGVNEVNIGNTMRRALEAFSTFVYKTNIEKLSCDEQIMKGIENKKYFENLMYRLVLHGESHFEEQIQNFHDGMNFFDFVSEDEKQKTARDILCLMYQLNDKHIGAHLHGCGNAIKDIQEWSNQLAEV